MTDRDSPPALPRLSTGVPGLDVILGGGLLAGDAYLVVGAPGGGKTTLGSQLAFAYAASGGAALVATLLTESHERMLAHLRGFSFFDPALVGERVRFLSLLQPLEESGVEGLLDALWGAVREQGATLLIVDGARGAEALAPSGVGFARFVHGLQARAAFVGCTVVLLASAEAGAYGAAGTHVDGVIELALTATAADEGRRVRVAKLRGGDHLSGRHDLAIGPTGMAVSPRLEAALAPNEPLSRETPDLVLTDAMMPRLDGAGLVARMRAERRLAAVPVVVVSAVLRGELRNATGIVFLAKPFDLDALLRAVETSLRSPGQVPTPRGVSTAAEGAPTRGRPPAGLRARAGVALSAAERRERGLRRRSPSGYTPAVARL